MRRFIPINPSAAVRFALLALPLAGLVAIAAARTLMPATPAPATVPAAAAGADAGDSSGEVELITLRPTGFDPSELTRPAGRFLFVVTKRGLSEDVTLQLFHQTGTKLREVRVARTRRHFREAFDLAPGSYVLTTAEHPEWVSNITVTPR